MLNGTNVLVVEPEYLIALEIQRVLAGRGATAFTSPGYADIEAQPQQFQLAIVALDPQGAAIALCRRLLDTGVPVVLIASASEHACGHPELPEATTILKPFVDDDLLGATAAALSGTLRSAASSS